MKKMLVLSLAIAAIPGVSHSLPPSPAGAGQSATAQPVAAGNYAQYLVDSIAARHPELVGLDLHATPAGTTQSRIVAARTAARINRPSDADDIEVFKTGSPRIEINRRGDENVEVALPLFDIYRQTIGVVELTFPYSPGADEDALVKKAAQYRDEMSRRILDAASITDAVQVDARVPLNRYAQFLVDDTIAKYPEVEVVAIHAAREQGDGYPIIASNIGRIGKPADANDLAVIQTGKLNAAADAKGARYEVKVPLKDATGAVIGTLAVIFPQTALSSSESLQRQAVKIAETLSPRIGGVAALYAAYPAAAPAESATVLEQYNKQELGNKQDMPMTKVVASGEALEQTAQEGYSEAIKNVAGVSATNSKGSPNDAFSIRGIKLNLFSNYRLNGGVPIAGVSTTPTEDKERVETLKGANALMFGVASPAGIINLVTKRAPDQLVASIGTAGNSFGQYGISTDLGQRFGAEKQIGVRVNLASTHLDNGVRGAGGKGDFESIGFDWRITPQLSFSGDYERYTRRVPEQAGISLLPAVNGVVPITPIPDPRKFLAGTWTVYTPRTENYQARLDYLFNKDWKVLAEAGQSESRRHRSVVRIGNYDIVTGAGGVVTDQPLSNVYRNTFFRSEVLGHFGTWFLSHNLTVGVSSTQRDARTFDQNNVILPQRQNIFDPVDLAAPVFTRPFTSLPSQTSKDQAVYFYDTIGVTPKLKLLLGLRETHEKDSVGAKSAKQTVKSPAYGVLYDIRPTTTLFASYMEGLEAGGTAPANAANANVILPSIISKQKEIGIRDSYFKGLSLSGSYFDIERPNAVTDPVTNIFDYNGNLRYKGVEFTSSYDITRAWTVNTAVQWLDSVQNAPKQPLIDGKVPENTPKWLGNLSASYKVPPLPGLTLTAGASVISRRPVNPQDQGYLPGYTLYSAGASYATRIGKQRVSVQVNVDNLANKRYWNSVQTGTYGIGMDRSFKFNAKVDL